MSQLNRTLGGDDDDGENRYDKIPDYIKESNFVFMLPGTDGKYIRVPLPYGYNIFWAMGQAIDKGVHNPDDLMSAAGIFAGALGDSFNPMGGSFDLSDWKSIVQTAMPTIARPAVELGFNRNFFGGPIVSETRYGPEEAQSHRALKSTPAMMAASTRWLNDATGGRKYQPGLVNLSPDVMKYLFDFSTGGVGKFLINSGETIYSAGTRTMPETRRIPFVRRFYGEILPYTDMKTFYDRVDKLNRVKADMKHFHATDPKKYQKFIKDHAEELAYTTKDAETGRVPLNTVIKRISDYRMAIKSLEEQGRDELVKKYRKDVSKIIDDFKKGFKERIK